jgi:glycine oxidase
VALPRDIVVIGAGIVGCAVAYELSRRGASVEIIDDRPAGMGATQAAAGVLAPFLEAHDGGPLLDLTTRSLDLFDRFVRDAVQDSGSAIRYHRDGTLDVATSDAGIAALEAIYCALVARGATAEWLDASAVRACEPRVSPAARRGLLIPVHGWVSAVDLTRALVIGARKHGAQIIEHGRARRILRGDGEIIVETERGSLSADAVVVAAGSWAGQIDVQGAATRLPIKPIRGQLLQLGWQGARLERVVWGEHCYVVPWDDRSVFVGATVEDVGFDEHTTLQGVRDLIDAVSELLPEAHRATFATPRVGLRPATPDHLPIIGPSSALPGVIYATGHYRNGILLAPLTATLVADALLDDAIDPILEATAPSRFGAL